MANELAKMYMAYGKGRTIPVEQQEQEQTASKPFTPLNVSFPMAGGYNLPQPKPTLTEQSLLAPTPVTPAPIVQPTVEQPLEQIQEAFKAESIESPITKQEEEKVLKDPVALRKYSKAGNMFARLGGFQEAPKELLATATPQDLNLYNQQKLQARNQGIGEMLLMLSDAFGGKDIAMRALERQKAKQPAKEDLTAAQRNYQTYLEIAKTGTPEEIQLAATALLGIRQGKSQQQLRNEVIATLTKQTNPITGEPYNEEDINEQIKILDKFYGKSEKIETEQDEPLSFEIPGYTITEG